MNKVRRLGVAALGDAEQLRPGAGGMLPGNQLEPGAQVAASPDAAIAATSALALRTPTPGMVTSRRVASSDLASATNSSPFNASILPSSTRHSARIGADGEQFVVKSKFLFPRESRYPRLARNGDIEPSIFAMTGAR